MKTRLRISTLLLLLAATLVTSQGTPPPVLAGFPMSSTTPGGPIQDAQCDVEQLEEANDSQLHTILQELQHTAFFRSFAVDLDHKCPLAQWRQQKNVQQHSEPETTPEPIEEQEQCASDGLPDLDPDAEPACSVQDDNSNMFAASSGFSTEMSPPLPPQHSSDAVDTNEETTEEEEFECDGNSEELDDDAEPLCDLSEDDFVEEESSKFRTLISSALRSIAELAGWEDDSQRNTFDWSKTTDPVIVMDNADSDDSCDSLPDNFWMDMCSKIKMGDGVKLVNLALNPERNTGYNGTHIWRAIYEENCISVDGSASAPMCLEERVLYRLLSGLHSSTTLSIAKNYYPPSKRKNRENWEPNPQYFMEKFEAHPEHLRNLHFSYVVLLRALQKASTFLYKYEIRTGNIVEDETATILLKRLLDSTILRSCQSVFSAFDESLMFQEQVSSENDISLQQNFKGVFHNISSILDCVQCQQCKLHGKMAMLGYGTALKILFTKSDLIPTSLERNEIVAFINTIAKFSESIKEVRELTHLYWSTQGQEELPSSPQGAESSSTNLVDVAVGLASSLATGGYISAEREAELVQLALTRDPDLLVLAKYYGTDMEKFLHLSTSIGELGGIIDDEPDAVVVGGGLAGLAATLNILDRGGKVVVVEKEHRLGGNSNKASSGINACCPHNDTYGDALETFRKDTTKSAGDAAQAALIDKLVTNSADAVNWLKSRVGVDLSLLAQLGGHSHKRTHRPSNGMVGAEIIYGMQKAVRAFEKSGKVKILVDSRVTRLLKDDSDRVVGVEYTSKDEGPVELRAPNVVLATGGFAADRTNGSYLSKHRPEFMKMPATAGDFSTGDGITLATALGAGTVDMDKVQIHPTGWVDPTDPTNPSKILAAELMRGVGGILLNKDGERFCNELGTRAYVTNKMLSHDKYFARTGKWDVTKEIPTFSLVLSSTAADSGRKHVDLYTHKGLLQRVKGVSQLASWMGLDVAAVQSSLVRYQKDAKKGVDKWGKEFFRGVPIDDLEEEVFYAGRVTPVLHYCMGGITIDTEGNVLDEDGKTIPGLHAAGEVAGGVHGNNRLGGNSLLECTVYGTIVGKKIPIKTRSVPHPTAALGKGDQEKESKQLRDVTLDELSKHNTPEDCWVAILGVVYDFTEFAEEHPAGAQSIHDLAGKDGTEAFSAVHNSNMLGDFDDERIGTLVESASGGNDTTVDNGREVTLEELEQHSDADDCWVAFHGEVYDMTEFAMSHPGGSNLITDVAGKDGTESFSGVHKPKKLGLVQNEKIGKLIM